MIKLDEIMRKSDDSVLCELLCGVRTAEYTSNDILLLKVQGNHF